MKKNEITQLTDREHVLLRSGTYLGSVNLTEINTFILNKTFTECKWKTVKYVPALLKIIYEILDNSIDESLRTSFEFANKIDITVDEKKEKITVKDNGRGIPLTMTKDANGKDISQFELALTSLRAGSNFNDVEGRTSLGQNGVGSACTNIFSKYFHAVSKDGSQEGDLLCENNMEKVECNIKKKRCSTTQQGTFIEFIPDYKRFKQKNLTEVHIDLLYQRIMFLSYMYPEIKFTFNGKLVKFKASSLMQVFSDKSVVVQDNSKICKYLIGVIPNDNDDFTHKSYINGADCINGGNHLDYIHSELVGRIKDKLSRKYPSIRPGDIKNRLSYVVCFREFLNPMFNSQTKENFSSDTTEIKEFLAKVDWDNFAAKVCKCDEIIDPIVASFKIKEELKNRQILNKLGNTGRKKIRCEKYLPATKENKYMAICEGDCLDNNQEVFIVGENEYKKISDIELGDLVLTHNQKISPVINKMSKLVNCFKLKTKSGKEVICSAEHRFFVYSNNKFCWKKLKDLNKETDKLINNKLSGNMIFEEIQIEKINNNKYQYYITGKNSNYKLYSSLMHNFVIFNKLSECFEVKHAKDINTEIDLLVLLKN